MHFFSNTFLNERLNLCALLQKHLYKVEKYLLLYFLTMRKNDFCWNVIFKIPNARVISCHLLGNKIWIDKVYSVGTNRCLAILIQYIKKRSCKTRKWFCFTYIDNIFEFLKYLTYECKLTLKFCNSYSLCLLSAYCQR